MFSYYQPQVDYYTFRYEFMNGRRGVIFDTSPDGIAARAHLEEEGNLRCFIKVGIIKHY